MIGLDTNVLLRLFVADDPEQAQQARRFVDETCTPETPAFVNCVVLTELSWVLAQSYDYSRSEVATVIEGLLDGDDRIVQHREAVIASLADYKGGRIEFVDALILHINRTHGCSMTVTFDRKASRNRGFEQIK
jgi:predicted nucleic-acid-binding protein